MTFQFRDRREGDLVIEVAFTASALDLGDRADPSVRAASLAAVQAATGAIPVTMSQVHGADVLVVDDAEPRLGTTATAVTGDALVTTRPGVALLTRAADCVPVLLADPDRGVIAAAHAGRQGVAVGVIPAVVARMRSLGADGMTAWVGPHVCGRCYEVPADLRAEVAHAVPETWAVTRDGTPALDLGAGVRAQLAAAGVDVVEVGACTVEDDRWPSHRRDGGAATRFAGVIWRSP